MIPARSASQAVQSAIYQRLVADTLLAEMGVSVYDDVPEGAHYPYIVVGESIETPSGSHGSYGSEVVPTLHVWSDYRGSAEANTISDRVVALLHQQPLDVLGHDHILTRFEFRQTLRDPLQRLRHVPMRFRIEVSQTED